MAELVEITPFGSRTPVYVTAGWPDREYAIAIARALYLADEIDVDELEQRIGDALEQGNRPA
jgi:ribosomal protein S19E (S16A)